VEWGGEAMLPVCEEVLPGNFAPSVASLPQLHDIPSRWNLVKWPVSSKALLDLVWNASHCAATSAINA